MINAKDVESFVDRYNELILSNEFIQYVKKFGEEINFVLGKDYKDDVDEPKIVKDICNKINGTASIPFRSKSWDIFTRSVFIHGNNYQVSFPYYNEDNKVERELGDIIFIITFVYRNLKYVEKMTILQFKKNKKTTRSISWDLSNKAQLYLLSKFPTFKFANASSKLSGLYALPNYTKTLGSYGLLYNPGEFIYISANILDQLLNNRNTLNIKDIPYCFRFVHCNRVVENIYYHYLLEKLIDDVIDDIMGTCWYTYDVLDFSYEYLKGKIGEPLCMVGSASNIQARNLLHDLLRAIQDKAGKISYNFVNDFFMYHYAGNDSSNDDGYSGRDHIKSDFDDGGIGIIHTTINLGE